MAPTLIPGLPKNFDPPLLHVLRPHSLPPRFSGSLRPPTLHPLIKVFIVVSGH